MSEEELTTSEALAELHELLRLAALGNPPQRLAATSYTTCREKLLQSELRPALPGFLHQCLTIFRFKDFIYLYSPNENERLAFVDAAIRACETQANLRPTFDVFGDRDF